MKTHPNMTSFITRFPDVGLEETGVIATHPEFAGLPAGEFGYVEFFCDDPGCDCRRVLIEVRANAEPYDCLATFFWGWEMADYYERWTRDAYAAALHVAGYLDPDSAQSEHAETFLDVFRQSIDDPEANWDLRIARHYEMFKSALGPPPPGIARRAPCIKAGREHYPHDYLEAWEQNT